MLPAHHVGVTTGFYFATMSDRTGVRSRQEGVRVCPFGQARLCPTRPEPRAVRRVILVPLLAARLMI